MDVDRNDASDGQVDTGRAEQAFGSLKSFARMAWEDCRAPLTDASGSAAIRWEIHSTWTLLLCLYHAEAEAERCSKSLRLEVRTEASALRQLFLSSHSLRALSAVLRWLRWAHRNGPRFGALVAHEASVAVAGYERTRRALQLQGALPAPLQQGALALHPDGPLQQSSQFHCQDLVEEQKLLAQLFVCLRHGDLQGALKLCADSGQAWRTAQLQGMLPFADGKEEVGYDATDEDGDEDFLMSLKEEHTDWTELGVVDGKAACDGNPWRRIWKEQCWDTAQRNLKASAMDHIELAIYGFCSGHYDALMAGCGNSWADRCWGELHCLKEWLVERLLEDLPGLSGGGDGPDPADSPRGRTLRADKLCGRLRGVQDVEAVVGVEVQRLLARLAPSASAADVTNRFARLQSLLIEAAWVPQQGAKALESLRSWVADDVEAGLWESECPFLVKQFASYFAIWQKDVLEDHAHTAPDDVDDIVRELVGDLVEAASGPHWPEQCLQGQAMELIAEHAAALRPKSRLEAFAALLLRVGCGAAFDDLERAFRPGCQGLAKGHRAQALQHCMWVFWSRFPDEAFSLLTVVVRRTLHLDDPSAEEEEQQEIGPVGVRAAARAEDIELSLLVLAAFWELAREKVDGIEEGLAGLEQLTGHPCEASAETFPNIVLETAVLPLFTDAMLCLSVKAPARAAALLPAIQASALYRDAFSSSAVCASNLTDLEWYLNLCQQHAEWQLAHEEALRLKPRFHGLQSEAFDKADLRCNNAVDALMALPRLAMDRSLMQPLRDAHTSLPELQWEHLRQALACRAILLLIEVQEDVEEALNLAVAVAQSPWLLTLLKPSHARVILSRMASVPTVEGHRV